MKSSGSSEMQERKEIENARMLAEEAGELDSGGMLEEEILDEETVRGWTRTRGDVTWVVAWE